MGPSTFRLLSASGVLALGLAVAPAMGAAASPAPAAQAVSGPSDQDLAALTGREAVLDAAAQHVGDSGAMSLGATQVEPPVWLLVLLVPILLGGTIGVGLTLRRLD